MKISFNFPILFSTDSAVVLKYDLERAKRMLKFLFYIEAVDFLKIDCYKFLTYNHLLITYANGELMIPNSKNNF